MSIIGSDAPTRTRLRKRVAVAFTPSAMARLEGRIRAVVASCVDAMVDSVDLIADLAVPLRVTVIAELLGIDPPRACEISVKSRRRPGHRWVSPDTSIRWLRVLRA